MNFIIHYMIGNLKRSWILFTYFINNRAGAMSLNQVVPNVANLKIGWFHSIKFQKSSGSIAPFSKIEWFHGTTGTTTNAGPAQ